MYLGLMSDITFCTCTSGGHVCVKQSMADHKYIIIFYPKQITLFIFWSWELKILSKYKQ